MSESKLHCKGWKVRVRQDIKFTLGQELSRLSAFLSLISILWVWSAAESLRVVLVLQVTLQDPLSYLLLSPCLAATGLTEATSRYLSKSLHSNILFDVSMSQCEQHLQFGIRISNESNYLRPCHVVLTTWSPYHRLALRHTCHCHLDTQLFLSTGQFPQSQISARCSRHVLCSRSRPAPHVGVAPIK